MATTKKRRIPPLRDQPQQYQHRVEMAIEALNEALFGAQKIVSFLKAQLCPGWPMYELLDDASGKFKQTLWRLKRAKAYRQRPRSSE